MTEYLTPVEMLRERVRLDGERIAHVVDGRRLGYAQWQAEAAHVSEALAEAGVGVADRVVLQYDTAQLDAYAVAYVAVLDRAAVAVPVHAWADVGLIRSIGEAAGASWLVRPGANRVTPQVERLRPAAMSDAAGFAGVSEILFTSGTTGEPAGYACFLDEICHYWEPGPIHDPRSVELHGAAFGTNYCQEMLRTPLLWGSTVVTSSRLDVPAMAEAMNREAVTTLRLTPPLAHAIVRNADRLPGLAAIVDVSVSSAYSPPDLLAALARCAPAARVVNQYSLTESGRAKLKSVWGHGTPDSIGTPVEGTQVRVVAADGSVVGTGVHGEIQLRHASAQPRVRVRGGRTETVVDPAGGSWIRTSDVGFLDGEGRVHLVDRSSDLINVGGRKVSPLRVEEALRTDPRVVEAAVVGLPHPTLGQVVGAAVVLRPKAAWSPTVLEVVADADRPRRTVVVDELPRNLAGKVLRDEVRVLLDRPARQDSAPALDATGDRCGVLELLDIVFEGTRPDLDQSWYEAGGDSLAALELMAHVEERYDVELPTDMFYGDVTLSDMVSWVLDERATR